jgi:hypothetical protein
MPGQDWRTVLPQILGAASGLRGNRGFAERWAELEAGERQRQAQAQQAATQAEQLGFQRDANTRAGAAETRATAADTRAGQDQALQSAEAIRALLGDETIDDPEEYARREAFATSLAPRIGADVGYVQSLRPAPARFEVAAAKKKLAEITRTYRPDQLAMLESDDATGVAPTFQMRSGPPLTLAQLRLLAGTQPMTAAGQPASMRVPVKPDVPNTLEEQQIADALAEAAAQAERPLTRTEAAAVRGRAHAAWTASGRAPAVDQSETRGLRNDLLQLEIDRKTEEAAQARTVRERQRSTLRDASADALDLIGKLATVDTSGVATLRPGAANLFGMRVPGAAYVPGSDTAVAESVLARLVGRRVLDLIAEMKAQSQTGATGFGQLSEAELELLQSAATRLGSRAISDVSAAEELARIYALVRKSYDETAPSTQAGTAAPQPPTSAAPPAAWTDAGGGFKVREKP